MIYSSSSELPISSNIIAASSGFLVSLARLKRLWSRKQLILGYINFSVVGLSDSPRRLNIVFEGYQKTVRGR